MKIKNFNDYEIYPEEGKIWSYKRNRFVGYQRPDGYWRVTLTDDEGEKWKTSIQRVIWTAVHGEIPEGMEINHTTEDKNMNGIQFLELVTHKENINFGTRTARAAANRDYKKIAEKQTNDPKRSKPVAAYKDNVLVMVFQSTMEAKRNGYNQGNVAACARGELKSYRGYQWKYIN